MPADAANAALAERLILLMGLLHSRFAGESLALMAESQITLPQLVTMHGLSEGGPRSVGQIGAMLNLSASATSHLVDRLFERGFVTREEDPADRRQKHIAITAEGLSLIRRLTADRTEQVGRAVAEIDPALRERLTDIVDLIIHQLRLGGPPGCPQS